MFQRFIVAVFCLAIALPASGQDTLAHTVLWEVTGKRKKEKKNPSYVFGTIHLIPAEDYSFSKVAEEALLKTGRITFEIDMDKMSNPLALLPMLTKMNMSKGNTLRSLLNDEDYALVKEYFQKQGMPFAMLERMKPMLLSALPEGGGGILSPGSNDNSMKSYEMELYNAAKKQKMGVEGLESIDYQMSLFDSIPYESQAQYLVESIRSSNDSTSNNSLEAMVAMYKGQNIDLMAASLNDESAGLSRWQDLLLHNRNKNWIPTMKKMIKAGPTFFAVGAAHLGGTSGVIRLLRAEGYSVKPILQ